MALAEMAEIIAPAQKQRRGVGAFRKLLGELGDELFELLFPGGFLRRGGSRCR